MSEYVKNTHFRKFSPIDREYPIFELVEDDNILLDITATDNRDIEVAVHEAATNKIFSYDQLIALLEEGRKLLEAEMD